MIHSSAASAFFGTAKVVNDACDVDSCSRRFAGRSGPKRLIENMIEPYSSIKVFSSFDLIHIYNRGVSFGLLDFSSSWGPYLLPFVCITAGLAAWAFRTESPVQRYALALIVGGASSNVLDRLDDGAVTDFLDFYIGAYHWPAFKLADAAIVCGVAAVLLEARFSASRPRIMPDEHHGFDER
jgi:signal peptidase II